MKLKHIVAICGAFLSINSYAECLISKSSAYPLVNSALKTGYNIEDGQYEAICKKLNSAQAALWIVGDSTVLNGKLISWVSISLKDKNSDIVSMDYSRSNTAIKNEASMHLAEGELNRLISETVQEINLDDAIGALNKKRANARKKT